MNGKTILLIDDETDLIFMLKGILAQEGYNVITAQNGQEGLVKLKHVKPDLIVLDMNMPKMGGIAFYHEIASMIDGRAKYPVLVLTARANLAQLFTDLNVDGFMTKPFEIKDFLEHVDSIISKHSDTEAMIRRPKTKAPAQQKRILIIEDKKDIFDQLVLAFVQQNYLVSGAQSGIMGIEKAIREQPDLVIIKLGLSDLPGDIVASKLKHMSKTMHMPLILYTSASEQLQESVTSKICQKMGITDFIASSDPHVILKQVDLIFNR